MIDVGGDDHTATRHFVTNLFGGEAFALSHIFHFARDYAFAGIVHLGADRVVLSGGNPLFTLLLHSSIIGWMRQRAFRKVRFIRQAPVRSLVPAFNGATP